MEVVVHKEHVENCGVCQDRAKTASAKEKRTFVYIMPPSHFEIPGCGCGQAEVQWSEFKEHLWCANCQKDFVPEHWGILEGPVCVHLSLMLGMNFDQISLETQEIERIFEEEREKMGMPRNEYELRTNP